MSTLIIGFNDLGRNMADAIKRMPEYGKVPNLPVEFFLSELSPTAYGSDLVTGVLDVQGTPNKVYRDGLQAVKGYSTSITSQVDWVIEELQEDTFSVIINCLPEGVGFVSEIRAAIVPGVLWINATTEEETLQKLRSYWNLSKTWDSIEYSEDFLERAATLGAEAEVALRKYEIEDRSAEIALIKGSDKGQSVLGYNFIEAIPMGAWHLIDELVLQSKDRVEVTQQNSGTVLIKHDLLKSFFGSEYAEQAACRVFVNPNLVIDSAIYVKYGSEDAELASELGIDSGYVIEYAHKGALWVLPPGEPMFSRWGDVPLYIEIFSDAIESAYAYKPERNTPTSKKAKNGAETIIFTFKEDGID